MTEGKGEEGLVVKREEAEEEETKEKVGERYHLRQLLRCLTSV